MDIAPDEERAQLEQNARHRGLQFERHLVFVGFMGAGKTSVGRRAAETLGRPFFDTDDVIEAELGESIVATFAAGGEDRFRRLEHETICQLLEGKPCVMSLGGGAMENAATRTALKRDSYVVHLAMSWETVRRALPRLRASRPMLKGRTEAQIHELYLRRQQNYRRAHLTIETPRTDVGAAVDHVLAVLSNDAALSAVAGRG